MGTIARRATAQKKQYAELAALVEEIRRIRNMENEPLMGPHPEPSCEAYGEWHNLFWNLVSTPETRWWQLGISPRPRDAEFVRKTLMQGRKETEQIRRRWKN